MRRVVTSAAPIDVMYERVEMVWPEARFYRESPGSEMGHKAFKSATVGMESSSVLFRCLKYVGRLVPLSACECFPYGNIALR